MRRPSGLAGLVALLGAVMALAGGCHGPAPCIGFGCGGACPRDAAVDASGRCACRPGTVLTLGACVPPRVADAYCGPAARATGESGGCAYPACTGAEVVDVDSGCFELSAVGHGGPKSCAAGSLVLEGGRFVCVPPEAACPAGSHAVPVDAAHPTAPCEHPPSCPAGTLPAHGACRPIVLRGSRGVPVVDLGAWSALVLGVDGGPGSSELCRPLQLHPSELGLAAGESLPLAVRVTLVAPDQDVTAVHGRVDVAVQGAGAHPLPPIAASLAERAFAALIEPLRGLGGQTSTTGLGVEVRCLVASF